MSSVLIPKETLSAYQRWEIASLEDTAQIGMPGSQRPVALPTVDQIQKMRDTAELEGYAAGFEEGRRAGHAEGRLQSTEHIERLKTLAQAFATELSRADELVASEVLDLALDVAKAMLRVGMAIQPQLVIPIVSEAIGYLPALHQPALLFLHPEDATLIKDCMGDELSNGNWQVAEDSHIERGGCRIETASNQIDATMGTRWQRIANSLGRESAWLA